jgi:outer membrane protein TolC
MKKLFYTGIVGLVFMGSFHSAGAQQATADSVLPPDATLEVCVQYALKHFPSVQQSLLDEQITETEIKSKLADWYPQLNFSYNWQHNFELSKVYVGGNFTPSGTTNASILAFGATQNLFNRDVLLASKTKGDVRTQIRLVTATNKIDITVNVSKAFYDVLLTQKEIDVLEDDILRLERNLKDTYNQYQGGLVDKTDYKRATISLNNAKAERKTNEEALKGKLAILKQLMGYRGNDPLHLSYDSVRMEQEIYVDTLTAVDFQKRVEYQTLMTQRRLQEAEVKYNKWSYIPTLSAFGGYNLNYFNNEFFKIYDQSFSSSFVGLQLNFPIFQGGKRNQNIRMAELQLTRLDWDVINLENSIRSEYSSALSSYKGFLNNYNMLRENLALAREVFNTIELQYRSGVKAYLDLITAETDLRTAQINYSNALFQVLSSKLDVEKALGIITY